MNKGPQEFFEVFNCLTQAVWSVYVTEICPNNETPDLVLWGLWLCLALIMVNTLKEKKSFLQQ